MMTFAEMILLMAVGVGIYCLLRPIQKRLESYLAGKFFSRHTRSTSHVIDVTPRRFHAPDQKDDDST